MMNKKNLLFWLFFLCGANFIFATALEEVQEAETANLSGTHTIVANGSNVLVDNIIVREDYDTFYVSAAGNDSNNGSITAPWKTLTKASAAANRLSNGGLLNPGDKILFNKGDIFEGNFQIKCSGTAAKPIEIGSYGTGELPILSGSGNIPTGDFIETIKMTDASHILMNNLWIKNDRQVGLGWTGSGNSSFGIFIKATKWGGVSKGLTFRNLKITDVFTVDMLDWQGTLNTDNHNAKGMFFDSNQDDDTVNPIVEVGINDVLIENCYFYNLGTTGVSIRHLSTGSYNNPIDEEERNLNYVIRNNTFQELGGDGIVFASVCNGLVEHNDFIDLGMGDHDNPSDRFFGRGEGCWIWDSRNIIVQFNKQLRAKGFGDTYGTAGHIDFYCKNAIYQYNYSEDTAGGFVEILGDCENSTFRYNVSVNDGYREHHGYAIWVSGYVGTGKSDVRSNNNFIYNNTVYMDKAGYTPDISIYAKNTYIYNNVFKVINGAKIGATGVDIDIASGSELVVSNNLFYGDIATAFTNLDANKIIGQDPQFVNEGSGDIDGYKLQATSPGIDKGKAFPEPVFPMAGQGIFANISLNTATDVYGNPVDVTNLLPNIGADNGFNNGIHKDAIRVTGATVSSQSGLLITGQTQQFTASFLPTNATNQNVSWSIDDTAIATVDGNGLVTGVADGAANLTATTADGSFVTSTSVNVGAEFIVNLLNGDFEDSLNNWDAWNGPINSSDSYEGNSAVRLYNKGAVNQWVTVEENTNYILSGHLKTSNTAKRVVFGVKDSNNNRIGSKDVYTANYAYQEISFNSGNSTSIKVFVWQPPSNNAYAHADAIQLFKDVPAAVTGVTISSQNGALLVGETEQLSATIAPVNATDKNVTWNSDNASVATVSNGLIMAVSAGTATITVTTDDGTFTDNTTITVSPSSIAAFKNGDFEDGLNDWNTWQDVVVTSSDAYEGSSLRNNGVSSCNQTVAVTANTNYIYSGYAKVDNPTSARVVIGVNDANSIGIDYKDITNQNYTYHEIAFNSGSNTSIKVYFWRPSGGIGAAYLDNAMLIEAPSGAKVSGKVVVTNTEKEVVSSVSIYPNPACDVVYINTIGFEGEVQLSLFNMLGVQVVNKTLNAATKEVHEFSVDELARGHYYLRLTDSFGNHTTTTTSLFLK
tara:strand:- start:313 stop:3774 length:3462 start_codon:yes stop_codon:yes gene_type:complete